MVGARLVFWRLGFLVLVWFHDVTTATLSPTGVNYEGQSSSSSSSSLEPSLFLKERKKKLIYNLSKT